MDRYAAAKDDPSNAFVIKIRDHSQTKDTRTVKPGFYAVPPQNIFEISPVFQQS